MERRDVLKGMVAGVGALGLGALDGADAATEAVGTAAKPIEQNEMKFWLETSLRRVFPNSPPGDAGPLKILAAWKRILTQS